MATKNDITGDSLTSKVSNKKYNEGWERIFGSKDKDLQYESDNPLERPFEPVHPAETRYPHLKEK